MGSIVRAAPRDRFLLVPRLLLGPAMALALLAPFGAGPSQAQELQEIARAIRRNQLELREFEWTSRTEIQVGNRILPVEVDRVRLGPGGEPLRTPIGADHRGKRRARGHARLREELDELAGLYARISPERAAELVQGRQVWRESAREDGSVPVRARGVVHDSDSMEIRIDPVTGQPRRLEVLTSHRGEPVRFTVEYSPGEQGPSFPVRSTTETETGEKKMVIRTENSDFSRIGGAGE